MLQPIDPVTTEKHGSLKIRVETQKERLGLSHWITPIHISNKPHPTDDACEAEIDEDWKYHQGDITFYSPFFTREEDHQEKIIVHELTHLLLCRLYPYLAPAGFDSLEDVTQTIAMLLYYK